MAGGFKFRVGGLGLADECVQMLDQSAADLAQAGVWCGGHHGQHFISDILCGDEVHSSKNVHNKDYTPVDAFSWHPFYDAL
jgi:hypothetical protein